MRYYYAIIQLDDQDNLVCIGVIDTHAEITREGYAAIDSYDDSLIGKMRVGESWHENPNPPEPIVETSKYEELSEVIDEMLGTETQGETIEEMQETVDEMLGGGTV